MLSLDSFVGLVVIVPYNYIIKLLLLGFGSLDTGPAGVCRTNSYGPLNCKGHAFVSMTLFFTKGFYAFSCICSYQFSHVCIFSPVQCHED